MKSFRKIIALITVLSIVFSLFTCFSSNLIAFAENRNTIVFPKHVAKEILSSNNYDTATLVDTTNADRVWDAANVTYKNSSVGVYPIANPFGDGGVLAYMSSSLNNAAVYIGADYETPSEVKEQTIAVEPGKTYTVSFDYYTTGTAGDPLNVWLAAGDTANKVVTYHTESAVNVISIAQNTDMTMDGWKTVTATITIPSDLDTKTYPYLILASTFGSSKGKIYFDNVSATEISVSSIISQDNYENAILVDTTNSDSTWDAMNVTYKDSSVAIYPVSNPAGDGKVLGYYNSGYDYAAVYIGADYATPSEVKNQTIKVEPGKTYTVKFDYYTTGSANNPLKVWLAAGDTANKIVSHHEESAVSVIYVPAGSNLTMNDWQTVTASITIPEDLDKAAYPYLMLSARLGTSAGRIYFDNVMTTVTDTDTYLQLKDEQFQSNDYENTTLVDTTNSDRTWDAMNVTYKDSSVAIYPVSNPAGDGKVLGYYSNNYDYAAVYIGADFVTPSAIKSQTVKAVPGKTYTVKFDYYTEGTAGNRLTVKLAAGNSANKIVSYHEESAVDVVSIPAGSDLTMSDWQTVTASITLPSDLDTSVYPYLIIRPVFGSSKGRIYFDNVSACSYAPLCVNYTIENKSDCEIFYDGVFSSEPFRSGNNSVLWYTDAAHKNAFSTSTIKDSTSLEVIDLYGVYENSNSALVKGDINLDNNFSAEDLVEMRKILLDIAEKSSQYRTDVNNDNCIDIRDLVCIKKAFAGSYLAGYTINNNPIENYKIVIPISDANYNSGNISNKVESLKQLINSEVVTDADTQSEYEIIIGNANRN